MEAIITYSSISSKIYMVKKIIVDRHFFWAEICEENKQNLQICHVTASATRVNQGVEPWVSQQPLAKLAIRNDSSANSGSE